MAQSQGRRKLKIARFFYHPNFFIQEMLNKNKHHKNKFIVALIHVMSGPYGLNNKTEKENHKKMPLKMPFYAFYLDIFYLNFNS